MNTRRQRTIRIAVALIIIALWIGFRHYRCSIGFLLVGGLSLAIAPRVRLAVLGSLLVSVGVTSLLLGTIDFVLRWQTPPELKRKYDQHYVVIGEIGKKPAGPGRYPSTSYVTEGGQPVYDVVYTIDENGLRQSPRGPAGTPTYIFFGCSFTYGEGVQDNETFPAQFAAAFGSPVTVMNMAFHGYGPHQMLFLLESGLPEKAITGPIAGTFYLAHPDHLKRVTGAYSWNVTSPHYEIDAAGMPVFKGLFAADPDFARLGRLENAGGLARLLSQALWQWSHPQQTQLRITTSIVTASARILRKRYGSSLVVLVWDDPGSEAVVDPLLAALAEQGITTVRVSSLIGPTNRPEYLIRAGIENHPSALADQRLGQALAQWWKQRNPAAPVPTD